MNIHLKNINFSYGETRILRSVDCTFQPGCFHAILGPNGSGKTTLLDILSGFTQPSEGDVKLGSTLLSALTRRTISQTIALVSQDYAINFPFTVEEVVLMGRHPYIDRFSHPSASDRELADQAMTRTGIQHLKSRKVTALSGGEKQRCVFARALCQDTPVLLLDEAFSNMDIGHTIQLIGILKKEVKKRQKTVIAVLHDLNTAATSADKILFLRRGKIVCHGNTPEVFTSDNIQAVFDVSARVEYNTYAKANQAYFQEH